MIPGLCGVVLVFVGTIITSLGVVRERQSGTLEQLAVMPLKPRDVFLGKIVPYFLVAAVDLAIVLAVGITIFGVPFRGSPATFGLGALLFLFVTLGDRRADLQRLPEPGPGDPASGHDAAAAGTALRADLPAHLDRGRGALDRLLPAADVLQPDLARRHAAGRADHLALAAVRLPRACSGAIVVTGATLRFRSYLAPAAREHRPRKPVVQPQGAEMTMTWGTDEVCVSYGKVVALDGVSLSAPPGQVTAVVGGDGAGKSTLLRCLAGALTPDSGTVRRPDKQRAGYLPASSGMYPDLTVAENLDFRAIGYGMSRRLARERAAEYLDRAGLTRRLTGWLASYPAACDRSWP